MIPRNNLVGSTGYGGNPGSLGSRLFSLAADPYRGATLPSPADLGLPSRYTEWRAWQYATVERILSDPHRFYVLVAATGTGKSLIGQAAAILSGLRTVLLTSTLGLQNQVCTDFASVTLDIRGQSNYLCPIATGLGMAADTTVAEAACQMGFKCGLRSGLGGGCDYYDRYHRAQTARNIVTNYSCWLHDSLREKQAMHIDPAVREAMDAAGAGGSDPRTPVELLIADEADAAPDCISSFVGVEIARWDCLRLHLPWPDGGWGMEKWQEWAQENVEKLKTRVKSLEARAAAGAGTGDGGGGGGLGAGAGTGAGAGNGNGSSNGNSGSPVSWSRELMQSREMLRKLESVVAMDASDEWVVDEAGESDDDSSSSGRPRRRTGGGSGEKASVPTSRRHVRGGLKTVTFNPLQVSRYAERYLFRGVRKVVLMSATVREKTTEMLGIPRDEMTFVELPSPFAPERRPVIFIPSVRMNYQTEQDDAQMRLWLHRLDSVIGSRLALGRKGVVHTVSYSRAKFVMANSEHRSRMMIHGSADRTRVVEEFKRAEGGWVLVSPSVGVGYDFANDLARWQVIAKLPFASSRDATVRERQKRDADYGMYTASQALIQLTGRTTRSESDWSETLVLDDNFKWFLGKARRYLPEWWLEAVVWADGVTQPITAAEAGVTDTGKQER